MDLFIVEDVIIDYTILSTGYGYNRYKNHFSENLLILYKPDKDELEEVIFFIASTSIFFTFLILL